MRVLLSTIGSRGDVQPLVALALQLRELGQEVRLTGQTLPIIRLGRYDGVPQAFS